MQPPDGGGGPGRRPALVDSAALATDMPELRKHKEVARHKVRAVGGGDAAWEERTSWPVMEFLFLLLLLLLVTAEDTWRGTDTW